MKKYIVIIFLLCSYVSNATTYYVAPTGNDNNTGTIGSPFATWGKLSDVLTPGDTGYIRGGTYTYHSESARYQDRIEGLHGTATDTIKILAYPNETPVWDFTGVTVTSFQQVALQIYDCDYLWIKGLRITNFGIGSNPATFNIAFNITNSSHNVIEHCTVDHIAGHGFALANEGYGWNDLNTRPSSNNLFLNCDAYAIADITLGNGNGFNIVWNDPNDNPWADSTTFRGCRAWYIADDGWDFYGCSSHNIVIDHCWAFRIGYNENDSLIYQGNGFKVGPPWSDVGDTIGGTMTNCISAYNGSFGILQNDHDPAEASYSSIWHYYNNLLYYNASFNYMGGYYIHLPHIFKNNIAWMGWHNPLNYYNTSSSYGYVHPNVTESYNTWNVYRATGNPEGDIGFPYQPGGGYLGKEVTDADFVSLDVSQLKGARQADGSLPVITFGHLVEGSDLIDAGVNVGISYNGSAPDIGAFEYGTVTPPIPTPTYGRTVKHGIYRVVHGNYTVVY